MPRQPSRTVNLHAANSTTHQYDGYHVQVYVVDTKPETPIIFFFTNNTGAPHGELLGLINLLSDESSICSFSSAISPGANRYRTRETGAVPDTNSILRTSPQAGDSPSKASNTSPYSEITRRSCNSC